MILRNVDVVFAGGGPRKTEAQEKAAQRVSPAMRRSESLSSSTVVIVPPPPPLVRVDSLPREESGPVRSTRHFGGGEEDNSAGSGG